MLYFVNNLFREDCTVTITETAFIIIHIDAHDIIEEMDGVFVIKGF